MLARARERVCGACISFRVVGIIGAQIASGNGRVCAPRVLGRLAIGLRVAGLD